MQVKNPIHKCWENKKGKVCSLAYELAASRHWPTFTQMAKLNSHVWLCSSRW